MGKKELIWLRGTSLLELCSYSQLCWLLLLLRMNVLNFPRVVGEIHAVSFEFVFILDSVHVKNVLVTKIVGKIRTDAIATGWISLE